MITIFPPQLQEYDKTVRLTSKITFDNTHTEMWFEVDKKYKDLISDDTSDSFVVALLTLAITSGQDIDVKGTMSSKLYYNLTHSLIPILSVYLNAERIDICANKLSVFVKNVKGGCITGFSGGVDSFCNYYDHSKDSTPKEFHISHFLYNNVGSHGQNGGKKDYLVFSQRLAAISDFAEKEGIPLVSVNSNIDEIVNINFQKTHTLRNSAVALLMQEKICKFLYASTYTFADTKIVRNGTDTAYMDPVILPLLSTERMDCISAGGQYTRVDKTSLITKLPSSKKNLDVCVAPAIVPEGFINCAVCWKCMRTEFTLMLLGKLEDYSSVFRIQDFELFKYMYLVYIYSTQDVLCKEIIELIKGTNYRVPVVVKVVSFVLPKILARQIVKAFPKLREYRTVVKIINAFLRF